MGVRRGRRGVPSRAWGAVVDQALWDALVERHCQRVWGTARGHGLDVAEAAEACQLAWLGLADTIAGFSAEAEVESWLCNVASAEAGKRAALVGGDRAPAGV